MSEGNQIFWLQLRRNAKIAVSGQRYMKDARHVVKRFAVDYGLGRRVDDCDFRVWLATEGSGIRIDVCAENLFSVGRQS